MKAISQIGPFSTFLIIGGMGLFTIFFIYNYDSSYSEQIEIRNYEASEQISELLARADNILASKHIPCLNSTASNNQSKNCITIVTAFFLFSKSKHDLSLYKDWMSNFLSRIDTPMTIFTQPSLVNNISALRKGRPTHFILYNEIWDFPWLKERDLNNTYRKMHDKDPEARIHSPELYAIWNSKLWMLTHVSEEENVFDSTFFYWMDIGSVRGSDHKLKNFPDVKKAIQVFGENKEAENYKKFNVFAISSFHGFKQFPQSNTFEEMNLNFVIGGFFGGTIFGIHWFSKAFYSIHDQLLRKDRFVGKDQTIYNFMATQYPDNILVVCTCLETNEECGDLWFYFQPWYASKTESIGDEGKCQTSPLNNMTEFLLQMKQ